ncbi:hypothetical protein PRVXH_001749 [Proteinivorax hydrogeniformans]|uniref:FtsX-like permease family protein n=1 Tax=Proteinivorax hydrogeniformans TaxID=1826727 RepID=A0AAU8HQK9_9FIRM
MNKGLRTSWNIIKILLVNVLAVFVYSLVAGFTIGIYFIARAAQRGTFYEQMLIELISKNVALSVIFGGIISFFIYKWLMKRRGRNLYEVCRFNKISWQKSVASFLAGMGCVSLSLVLLKLVTII